MLQRFALQPKACAAPLCPEINDQRPLRSLGPFDRLDEELRSIGRNEQLNGKRRPRLLRRGGCRRLDLVAELRNSSRKCIRPCSSRIIADGDQIPRVIPANLLRTVDPFQGRRDRIRSPHSRGARLGFHHAVYLEGYLGKVVMRGNFASFHLLTASTASDGKEEDHCMASTHLRLRSNSTKCIP